MTAQEIKDFCKENKLTQKELAGLIGMGQDSLNTAISSGKISNSVEASVNLLRENMELKKELQKYKSLKEALKEAIL